MSDKKWPYLTPGIRDEDFCQDRSIPLTKEEVRVLVLSKSRIGKDQVIYDVGAGTGSISIESALLARKGRVYAIEGNPAALGLLQKNKELFQVDNLEIIEGNAPEALEGLPRADRIIIGGSGGRLKEILEVCATRIKGKGIITVTAVTMNTLALAQDLLDKDPWENLQVVQIGVNRAVKAGRFKIFKALNPVFILTAERGFN
ncbi:MAG: precorrin-6Y C5,15-methyltransferase (decarboxylating) subunit CbiT [Candidatus Syntrophonatronum acetioxidans]|uniref:Precorrin-6Y C5,15-methyltransferase (Decarboxylating) subunit CbiT n=1 Tax=Candidatus Syntrophonatronum acetioxidans TaxID=1795816 RepID=A0A424YJ03_9FIRM|nr:MAG: precorrin-6Y C5,15-methyltransferase (decarboxylating) subunit CbiT [Candidatus Syntrophonatronum acetioxidans]